MYHHINCNHILANEQFGFGSHLSTEIASYNLTTDMLSSFSSKLLVSIVVCDLQKAFDCVNHDILLSKVEFYGILGNANKLIKSYLKDRYQRVLLKNNSFKYFSKWQSVKHRVSQGSILGPLFFVFYSNDLPKIISDMSKLILFANDTSIIITNSDPYELKKKTVTVCLWK